VVAAVCVVMAYRRRHTKNLGKNLRVSVKCAQDMHCRTACVYQEVGFDLCRAFNNGQVQDK
jgi:hypothetical protein